MTVAAAQTVLRLARHLAIGILSGTLFVLILAVASGLTLTRDRLISVARDGLASGELAFDAHRDEDYFTECSMLTMLYLRHENVFLNAIETRLITSVAHPCEELQAQLAPGQPLDAYDRKQASYVNYPFGSRYLEALTLSVLDLRDAKRLYALFSYGSVVILFLGAWRNSPTNALIVLPVGVFLVFGFALHRFGHNLAHAPGYFVGFTALGVFLAAREWFRSPGNRVVFFGFLGTLIAFFDLMHGSIPVVLSLAIVLNHLFYVAPNVRPTARQSPGGYWLLAVQQAVIVCACFVVAYGVLTGGRLLLLSGILDGGYQQYAASLGSRLGNVIPGRVIGFEDVVQKLWQSRFQLTAGGFTPSTWMLFVALAAWIFTICLLPLASWRRGPAAVVLLADLTVVAIASAGVLSWYRLFLQHTFIHVLFIARIAALPASYGLVTATLVVRFLAEARTGATRWVAAASAIVSVAAAAYLLDGTSTVFTSARLAQQPAVDAVACAPLGLRSDGTPDGLIELSVRTAQASPPLALVGAPPRAESPVYLRLERSEPPGWWETGSGNYILGVTRRPNSELINLPDGTIVVPPRRPTLWVHFCRDGHDTPDSRYMLHVGDRSLAVEKGR